MANQIIKQPNGRYAVWSTIIDDFICMDVDRDELIEMFVEKERRNITERVDRKLGMIADGQPAYRQFTKTFDDCVNIIRDCHGDQAYLRIRSRLAKEPQL